MLQHRTESKTSTVSRVPGTHHYFINALNAASQTVVELGITLAHVRTGEEAFIDLITEDYSLKRTLDVIREHFGIQWSYKESWAIDAGNTWRLAANQDSGRHAA